MRIDLETHYSVHPFLPSPPPLLSKNETYFEACSLRFTTPKKRRGPRRKANFNFRRDNRLLPPFLPLLAATRCLLYLSYSRGEGSGEEDTVVDSRRRSASEMNFIAQLGSFIGKISCASARKPPEVDIGAVVLDGSLLSFSLSLSLSLSFSRVLWSILLPFVHGTVHWSYNLSILGEPDSLVRFISSNERSYNPVFFFFGLRF